MSLIIQHPLRTDLPAMMALNAASMPEIYVPSFWTHHLNQFGDMFYVAKLDGKVIGYVMCREETVNYIRMGLVISVAVDPAHKGQEIGCKLMYEAHRAMRERNIPMACLQVRKSNEAAIRMYEKLGYFINMKIPQYYTNPEEDGWLMSCVL
jgi:ribosomal-protein-alanine N-acetyltransferase